MPAAGQFLTVEIEGVEGIQRKLEELGAKGPEQVGQALYSVALDIFADSQMFVPVDTGTLKGSGGIEGPYESMGSQEVLIYYGGPAAEYAVMVHEDLDMYHTPPTQAKFLEAPYLMHLQDVSIEAANALLGVVQSL